MGERIEPLDFPAVVSLTVTNRCNLRCRMCGQWGMEGYMKRSSEDGDLPVECWMKVVDEVADHGGSFVCIRGGEPFMYPAILDLVRHIKGRGLSVSFDSNGTLLKKYAEDIVGLGVDNINLSVDGPERVHDRVRGIMNCFKLIAEGVAAVRKLEAGLDREPIIKTIVFTISPWSYRGLVEMPQVARQLGIPGLAIVPYYYFDSSVGAEYEEVMRRELECEAYSWRGFRHETSGVDIDELLEQYRRFRADLGAINLVPYMDCAEGDYRTWFGGCRTPVGKYACRNPWRLIDIQPAGDANFCVDFPDYVIGHITEQTIAEMWRGERARRFREYLEEHPLPICHRCGAKYMSKNASDPPGV